MSERERVDLGVALLDRHVEDWRPVIKENAERLNMAGAFDCVLGILFSADPVSERYGSPYDYAVLCLFGDFGFNEYEAAREHGFDATGAEGPWGGAHNSLRAHNRLRDEWLARV